jgi:hypothetical protein
VRSEADTEIWSPAHCIRRFTTICTMARWRTSQETRKGVLCHFTRRNAMRIMTVSVILSSLMLAGCDRSESVWEQCNREPSRQVYAGFMESYPKSPHVAEARAKVERIDDSLAWIGVETEQTFAAASAYAAAHPQGVHIAELTLVDHEVSGSNPDSTQVRFVLRRYGPFGKSLFSEFIGRAALLIDFLPVSGRLNVMLNEHSIVEHDSAGVHPALTAFRFVKCEDDYDLGVDGAGGTIRHHIDAEASVGDRTFSNNFIMFDVNSTCSFVVKGAGTTPVTVALILRSRPDRLKGLTIYGRQCPDVFAR